MGATRHAITLDESVPIIDVNVAGAMVRAVLDSGAALSYVPRVIVANRAPIRRERDFHPAIGPFDVDVWSLSIFVGTRPIVLEAGVLPSPLDRMLQAGLDPRQ